MPGNIPNKSVAVVAVVASVVGLVWASSGSTPGLALRHRLQTWLKPLAAVATVRIEGVAPFPLFLDPDDSGVTPWLWAGQPWEATETRWFVRSVRPGAVVVDVGANVGYYTVLAGRLVGEEGRVYAFEPDPTSFEILRRNVRLNGLHNVVLEQKAVSNEPGFIKLYIAGSNKGDHRIYQPEGEHRPSVDVEAVTLDAYFARREDAVDFVKVDTQGAEAAILEGMVDLVRRSDAIVMAFEYSPRHLEGFGTPAEGLLERMGSLDLQMFELGMGGPRVNPLHPVTIQQLQRRFPPAGRFFTNLLLVKGRPELLAEIDADAGDG